MAELDAKASYNRTLDMSLAQVPYGHYQKRTAVFRKNGVRTAYTFRDKAFVPMMYHENNPNQGPARDFARFATEWELRHSRIPLGDGHGSVHPVVDERGLVIGHYGTFDSNSIFVPADIPVSGRVEERPVRQVYVPGWRAVEVVRTALGLKDYLELGADVIADRRPGAQYSGYNNYAIPQTSFSVVTDVEGHVLLVLSSRNKDGVTPSSFSPLDLITVVALIFAGGAAVGAGAVAVRTLIRRRSAKALEKAGKLELTAGSASLAGADAVITSGVTGPLGKLTAPEIKQAIESSGGRTVELFTKLTQAPAPGKAISFAAGPQGRDLANAARSQGQIYVVRLPDILSKKLEFVGLIQKSTTQMERKVGTEVQRVVGTEYRVLPQAADLVIRFLVQ